MSAFRRVVHNTFYVHSHIRAVEKKTSFMFYSSSGDWIRRIIGVQNAYSSQKYTDTNKVTLVSSLTANR